MTTHSFSFTGRRTGLRQIARKAFSDLWPGGICFITLPEVLLLFLIVVLLYITVVVCIRSVKAPESMAALKTYLGLLQGRLTAGSANPEVERAALEMLQNNLKASCHQSVIGADKNLQALSASNCRSIGEIASGGGAANQTAWLKLRTLVCNFDEQYYPLPNLVKLAKPGD